MVDGVWRPLKCSGAVDRSDGPNVDDYIGPAAMHRLADITDVQVLAKMQEESRFLILISHFQFNFYTIPMELVEWYYSVIFCICMPVQPC